MPDVLSGLLEPGDSESLTLLQVLVRMAEAGLLGSVVAWLYHFSLRGRAGAHGLTGTLLLVSMLITMVSIAIDGNVATAFTLVGTLAIVRFRTPVREVRDTAFVIFAVVVGLSVGGMNRPVSYGGTAAVGIAIIAMTFLMPNRKIDRDADDVCRVSVRFHGLQADRKAVTKILKGYARDFTFVSARTNRAGDALHLNYDVHLKNADQSADLVTALRSIEQVNKTYISFGNFDDD